MKKNLVRILALLLIAAMLLPLCARAEENTAEEDTGQTVYEEYPVSTAEDLPSGQRQQKSEGDPEWGY